MGPFISVPLYYGTPNLGHGGFCYERTSLFYSCVLSEVALVSIRTALLSYEITEACIKTKSTPSAFVPVLITPSHVRRALSIAWFSLEHKHKQKHKKNEHVRSSCASAYVAVFTLENGGDTRASQSSQLFRPPSCLTSRGANIENSVKEWFSARASVLMLM